MAYGFGDGLLFTSSFGAQSAVLLHLWSTVARSLPVVFIDTGFLFPETLGIIMAVQLLIGRYTGYRLSELFRFREFIQASEA